MSTTYNNEKTLQIFRKLQFTKSNSKLKKIKFEKFAHIIKNFKPIKSTALIFTLFAACFLTACGANKDTSSKGGLPMSQTENSSNQELSKAQQLLSTMSDEEKVGQLFIIRPEALDPALTPDQVSDTYKYGSTALSGDMAAKLASYPVGGVALFGKNIQDPAQLSAFVSALKNSAKTPLLIGIDEEGGKVSRIGKNPAFNVKQYESMAKIGDTGESQNAFDVGSTIGEYLKQYGFNLDFAPVADVNTNPENPVIGERAFSSKPEIVGEMVTKEIQGLSSKGIISCIKHFPGHGDTKEDTHDGYAHTNKTWQEMLDCELIPFKSGIAGGTDMVMVAHITADKVASDGLPSSLSYEIVSEKLRGELGFQGVVITDSMAMGAIAKNYSSGESALAAINAGVDIILMPEDFTAAYDAVLTAVKNGQLSRSRLDESVLRILNLKEKYGLI